MISGRTHTRPVLAFLLALALAPLPAGADTEWDGHTKLRGTVTDYPSDSLFRELVGSNAADLAGILRLNLRWRERGWSFEANGQLIGLYGDQVELSRELPPAFSQLFPRFIDDRRRLLDLTTVLSDSSKSAVVARLDRLSVGWTGEKAVIRLGRQALTWGNGLFYAPMDLVNPFDPATIDTEYKPGDDMAYFQYLQDNGNDLQAAYVARRNLLTGEVEADAATFALKYHGFTGAAEYDLLAAEHYGNTVLGLGGTLGIGGAILRGDIVLTDAPDRVVTQLVTSLNYSWIGFGKNMTGGLEYHYNGFGQTGEYDLANDPELLLRLARGELFTIARHYLAGTVTIEMSPLWTITPVMLANLQDPSALFQFIAQGSLSDNSLFIGTLSVPAGASGSEFGGIESGIPGRFLSNGVSVFLQYAWYF